MGHRQGHDDEKTESSVELEKKAAMAEVFAWLLCSCRQ
jgi:hypothetical protein